MNAEDTVVQGAYLLRPDPHVDERGAVTRTYDRAVLAANGMVTDFVQGSVVRNPLVGTLRGLHYQEAPHGETKLVRCSRGRVFDVLVDLRPESASHRRWVAFELCEEDIVVLYVPIGVAHGYLTLTEHAEMTYLISSPYEPGAARGVRWDDPTIGVAWPRSPTTISERDRSFPDLEPARLVQ